VFNFLSLPVLTLDGVAVIWFFVAIVVYRFVAEWGPFQARSIAGAVQAQRRAWMSNMAMRENRVLDGVVLQSLSQGNAFFASTSVIVIGGLSAILGSGEKVQELLERLPLVYKSSAQLWEMKVLLLISIFVFGFFKFAWAFRLSHYTGIMIGATPILDAEFARDATNVAACQAHADRTAALIGYAAEHANSGLRAFYYAIAGMAWFFHPVAFILASTWIMAILVRRDFFSRSRKVIGGF
jgi:uncharacterized membrane protein